MRPGHGLNDLKVTDVAQLLEHSDNEWSPITQRTKEADLNHETKNIH